MSPVRRGGPPSEPRRKRQPPRPANQCKRCSGKGFTRKLWWAPPWISVFTTEVLCEKCNGSDTTTPRRL